MTGDFAIRAAVDADLAEVKACLAETWHATYDPIFGAETVTAISSRWHAMDALRAEVLRALQVPLSATFLVAAQDQHIVGTASARLVAPGHISLSRLYVLPRVQGRGLGKKLLAAALLPFDAVARVTLDVEPRNTQALGFYTRQGFRQIALEEREHAGVREMAAVLERAAARS